MPTTTTPPRQMDATTALEVVDVGEIDRLADQAHAYIAAARSEATIRAYRSDWRCFTSWCTRSGRTALPADAETVALYLTDLAGTKAPATIQRRVTSIAVAHRAAGYEAPTRGEAVRSTMRGIRRTFGTAQDRKAPVRTGELRELLAALDRTTMIGRRDAALLLVGFAGAMRRSELVALDVADVDTTTEGLLVAIRRSKTDQEGAGEKIGLPLGTTEATCPAHALADWLESAGIEDGPIFRAVNRHGSVATRRLSDQTVAQVVKRTVAAAGLDPADYAGHSLRSGFITSAAQADVPERHIMRHSRHKSIPVMRGYIHDATIWRHNAASRVGL